jgi:hypothetical protein
MAWFALTRQHEEKEDDDETAPYSDLRCRLRTAWEFLRHGDIDDPSCRGIGYGDEDD